ncbi:MAG: PAS domain-containing protein, partial [Planctomycetes bacterium]|nr:PAS domain-containing protein [Planctomycetota bacterium]
QSQGILEAFYESTPLLMGVVEIVDDEIVHLSDNPATARMFGRTPLEMVGVRASDLGVPPEAIANWIDHYDRSRTSGQPASFEYEHHLAGVPRWFSTTVSYLGISPTGHHHHSYVIQDVTLRKAHIQELEQARIEAEAANRAKSEFLANMSHELRTPLTAILGFSEIAVDRTESDERRAEAALTIRRNGEHLLQLINDILDVSKLEAGQLSVEVLEFSPIELLKDVCRSCALRAEQKGLGLELEIRSDVPETVRSDPTRLRQILVNLIGNAVKFSDCGVIVVRLRFDPDTGRLEVEVLDNGIGMSDEQQRAVFEPFVQADSSMTRRFGGTGLGLAISQQLAKLLGGEISVRCKLGEGCVFTVSIAPMVVAGTPLVRDVDSTIAATPVSEELSGLLEETRPLEGLRILYAEDGVDNRRLVSHLLSKAGADIEVVEDGSSAILAALGSLEFLVVLGPQKLKFVILENPAIRQIAVAG